MYSKAQVEAAMLEAARFIQQNPDRYNFFAYLKPNFQTYPIGCLLGWTGYFLGIPQVEFSYPQLVASQALKEFFPFDNNLELAFYRQLQGEYLEGKVDIL